MLNRCKCKSPNLTFKKFDFERGRRAAYRGTCLICGLVRCWTDANNFKLIATCSSPKPKGGKK